MMSKETLNLWEPRLLKLSVLLVALFMVFFCDDLLWRLLELDLPFFLLWAPRILLIATFMIIVLVFTTNIFNGKSSLLFVFLVTLSIAVKFLFLVCVLPPLDFDVYWCSKAAIELLLRCVNPYNGFNPYYNQMMNYSYPPLMILFNMPFYFLGDIRLGHILADTLVGYLIFLAAGKRRGVGVLASVIFLFNPYILQFGIFYSNNDVVPLMFFLFGVYFMEKQKYNTSFFLLSFALLTKHYIAIYLVFVFVYFLRKNRKISAKLVAIASCMGIVSLMPFFIWDSEALWWALVKFQVVREPPPFTLSLNALYSIPFPVRVIALVVPIFLLLYRTKTIREVITYGSFVFFLWFIVFVSFASVTYLLVPLVTLMYYVGRET